MTKQELEIKLANFRAEQDKAKVEFERAKLTMLRLEGAIWILEELLEEMSGEAKPSPESEA